MTTPQIESDMLELVQLVLQNSSDSFLTMARGFYYRAYCDPETIHSHIQKVLFEKVM